MIQGTSSGAGKSTIVTGLCRILSNKGFRVFPFKSQNMSSNSFTTSDGRVMAQAQAVQAVAARCEPDPRMNPILLKPLGSYRSNVFVDGRILHSEMQARDYYQKFAIKSGLPAALAALDSLRKESDIVVIEGAGSPAEINIARYDIANMILAQKAGAPVIITADIERGGCFASMVGTMRLLQPAQKRLVKGFLINNFRGDPSLLEGAVRVAEKILRRKIIGIIPRIEFSLPEEDSLGAQRGEIPRDKWDRQIDIIASAIDRSVDIKKILQVARM